MRLRSTLLVSAFVLVACASDATRSTPSSGPDASLPDAAAAPAAAWTARASLPAAVQETAVVSIGNNLYVIGGLDAASKPLADVHVYDGQANKWSTASPMPRAFHHVNAAVVEGQIWVLGALADAQFTATSDAYSFNPQSNMWAPRPPMRLGTERGASMVAAIGRTIYVAGGLREGQAVADFSSFDVDRGDWTILAPLPVARDHGVGFAMNGIFYAVGGRARGVTGHTARVDAFNPATSTWTERASMPTSRAGAAGAIASDRLVVIGGEGDAKSPTGVFAQVEAYDPVANAWTSLAPMKTPRHGMGAATVGGVIVVPGGGVKQALAPTDIVEALAF